jgi:hypothetical protein
MFENLKKWLINKLGGYHYTEWRRMCYKEHKKHEKALAKKDELIRELAKLTDSTPEDCKRGTWCSECIFVRRRIVYIGQYPYSSPLEASYCGKDGACKNLVLNHTEEKK